MPSRTVRGAGFSPDLLVFLRLLAEHRVRYVIVVGEAVIFHGYPRVTGDVDFFYDRAPSNVSRLFVALREFWSGHIPGIKSADELREPGVIIQFGRPPNRIDLLNQIDGVSFAHAWQSRILVKLETKSGCIPIRYINREPLLRNKRASGRAKDLDDARFLAAKRLQPRPKNIS